MDFLMITPARFVSHGFVGQQMVVVPAPLVAQAASHPLLRSLQVTDAGFFPEAKSHGIERMSGVAGAILIVCRAGQGWYRLGRHGAIGRIAPGDALLIGPHQAHAYGAGEIGNSGNFGDSDEIGAAGENGAWTIQWAHFMGSEVAHWWAWLGLPAGGGVVRLRAGATERLDLARVHGELAGGLGELHLVAAAAALRWALAHLEAASAAEIGDSARERIEEVERWMREHPGRRTSLTELARRAGLSVPHFSMLFRQRFGCAPMEYFLRWKIRQACTLLETTEWPIARVAAESGFADALYFSRKFRKMMGLPPTLYRTETHRGNIEPPARAPAS
jgi:AraC-like DNA-binding protein